MDIIKIFGFIIAACAVLSIIKQYAQTYYMAAAVAACGALLLMVLAQIEPVLALAKKLSAYSSWAYIDVVIKAVGIAVISQTAQDICKDCGHTSLAGKASLAGKLCIMTAALPLFAAFADIIRELLE
jgi:stage III sporulation protein AD